jgi:hypothetical protein
MDDPERNAAARRDIRAYLAQRSALAFRPSTIRRHLNLEADFSLPEIEAALCFLIDLKEVEIVRSDLSAVPYYKTTPKGIIAFERNAL